MQKSEIDYSQILDTQDSDICKYTYICEYVIHEYSQISNGQHFYFAF